MRPSASSRRSAAKAAPVRSAEVSLYDEVTRKIITQLEAGRVPWVQPWGCAKGAAPASSWLMMAPVTSS